MKLRNKKTGVVGEVGYISTSTGDILVSNIHDQEEWYHYKSLAGLNAEWEDVTEEPKECWYINEFGTPTKADFVGRETLYGKCRKNFGNYFETKEEAEQAVKKLKAYKRLRDKGFRFVLSATTMDRIDIVRECFDSIEQAAEARDDIITLFGGEECS